MKLTTNIKMRLEALKDKFCLRVSGDSFLNREIELFFVSEWKTKDIPEKKGIFGHPAYQELTDIRVVLPKHIGTNYIGIFEADSYIMERLENSRKLFIKLKEDIDKFGYDVTKRENHTI